MIEANLGFSWRKRIGEECATCDKLETTDHILFQCPIVVFMWSFLRNTLGWRSSPTNHAEFLVEFVDNCRGKKQKIILFICAGALWTIWKTRNDMVFNKKVLSSPVVIIYKTLMLIKTWRPLLKTKLRPIANAMINLWSRRMLTEKLFLPMLDVFGLFCLVEL